MPSTDPLPTPRSRPPLLAAGIIVLLLAAAAVLVWWRVIRPQRAPSQRRVPAVAAVPVRHEAAAVGNGRAQALLGAARAAMRQQHLVAPAGHNAVALYLQARAADPHDRAAGDALREIFPFAAQAVEQAINAGHTDAAQRELDLLRRVDATNYTLTLLQAKLAAQRRTPAGNGAVLPRSRKTLEAPDFVKVAAPKVTGTKTLPPPAATPAPASVPSPVAASTVAPSTAPPVAKATATQPPLLLHMVDPYYPAAARAAHRSGWVDVGYTVTPQGTVRGEHVLRSRPGHIFDHAALSAVHRWRFRPARRGGHAVAVQVVSRVDFNR